MLHFAEIKIFATQPSVLKYRWEPCQRPQRVGAEDLLFAVSCRVTVAELIDTSEPSGHQRRERIAQVPQRELQHEYSPFFSLSPLAGHSRLVS